MFSCCVLLDIIFAPLKSYLPSSGTTVFIVASLVGLIFVVSLAAFSYLFVAGIERRSEGTSLIMASSLSRQGFVSCVLLILAAGAILLCFRDGFFSAGPIRNSNYYVLLRRAILSGWALVMGGLAIHDVLVVAGRRLPSQSA